MTPINLENLVLKSGSHNSRSAGVCFMEAVAWFAGERHTDHPRCVSPVIGAFCRTWNDHLDDAGRQRLKPYVARVVGTAGNPAVDEARAWLVTDWMVRVHTPAWLELGGMKEQADALRVLPTIESTERLVGAQPSLDAARERSDAASDAAWAAARDAARDAAWDAARDAAWDAARDAAWAAARDAGYTAAMKVLEPTKLSLQESAFQLLDRMIDVGRKAA